LSIALAVEKGGGERMFKLALVTRLVSVGVETYPIDPMDTDVGRDMFDDRNELESGV